MADLTPIVVLLVDDQLGSDATILRAAFGSVKLVHATLQSNPDEDYPDGAVVRILAVPGQTQARRSIVNDTRSVMETVRALQAQGQLALVLLDMRFDSGLVGDSGRPVGALGDERFGAELYRDLRREFPGLPAVFLSTYDQAEIDQETVGYLSKSGLTDHSVTSCLLRNARLSTQQRSALLGLRHEIVVADSTASAYLEAFEVAPLALPILITGETGAGKDVLAQFIHRKSARASGPFVPVNVNAIPKDLFEAMFFGHMRGAYTGAMEDRPGYFEQADGGTLFLDEIGDLAPDLQVKLLRALETRAITRIGGKAAIPVDVRLVAATNRAVSDGVVEGLRGDFRFRLSGHVIHLLPLRERRADIQPLTDLLVAQAQAEYGKSGIELAASARAALDAAPLPGNARELRQLVFSAVARAGNRSLITAKLLGLGESKADPVASEFPAGGNGRQTVDRELTDHEDEVQILREWLERCPLHNIRPSAEQLRGLKPQLDEAFSRLNRKLAAAALEATKRPMSGDFVLTAAAQLLYGDPELKGNLPARRIAAMLGINQTQKFSQDDLKAAISDARDEVARNGKVSK